MSFCPQKLRDSRQVLSGVGSPQRYAGEHITRLRLVVSAWGERADRYRNLQAAPAIEIRTGR